MKRRLTPLGIHLFDREIGLNLLFDEVVILQDEMAVAPRYLSIALTNACDLECAYCYAPKHHAVLDSATIIKYAQELDAAGAIGLGFGGGEPTLFPGLDSLCRSIASETDLAVTMTTHGHWKKGLADRLSGNIHFVRISMDGLGSTYERLRGRRFDHLLANVGEIAKCVPFGINYVVNGDTQPYLPAAVDLAMSIGAKEFLLLPEVAKDGTATLSEQASTALATWIADNYRHYPLAISVAGKQGMELPELPIADPRGHSFDFMHIDAGGYLRECAFSASGISVCQYPSLMDAIHDLRRFTACISLESN